MAFEFDPAGVGQLAEFSLVVPKSDAEHAVRLKPRLQWIPKPQGSLMDILIAAPEENIGGSLTVEDTGAEIRVAFGFNSLPPENEVPADMRFTSYRDRQDYQLGPQLEHIAGRQKVLGAVAKVTAAQYQFGVPFQGATSEVATSPTRFSYRDGHNVAEPRVIITDKFDDTMYGLAETEVTTIRDDMVSYLRFYNPACSGDTLGLMTVPSYGRIFGTGTWSFGQRTETLSDEEIASSDTLSDHRLQPGDKYIALGHNLGDAPHPQILIMVAVGSISRLCRERYPASDLADVAAAKA